ncbi:MAG TPA: PLDc N-terminal domain-containing protein [Gammaproteobacteria bacterium]
MIGEMGGLIGLIVLIADIWAIINIIKSGATTGAKVIWVLVVIFLPVVGFIAWLIFGPKGT